MSPETPADTRDMYMVHTMFRREFAALPALVGEVGAGDTERAHVVAEHIGFLSAVLDAHHRAEDAHLWPKLLDRGGDEVGHIVQVMQDHHERIEQLIAQTVAVVGEWRRSVDAEWGRLLADVLVGLERVLDEHMNLEEQRILPMAERYVTAAEWHSMAGASGAKMSPEKIPLIFGMTLHEADPQVMENTLSALPSEVRAMLEERGPRDFAAYSQRVHGAPAPRRSAPLKPSQK
jgi:hemerythrin-like domain-containing protein